MDNRLDIFKKEKDGTLVWIAAVDQLHTAAALVAELSEKYPVEYRVFDKRTGETFPSNGNRWKQGGSLRLIERTLVTALFAFY